MIGPYPGDQPLNTGVDVDHNGYASIPEPRSTITTSYPWLEVADLLRRPFRPKW